MREIGQLIGPAVAAGLLLFSEPELVLALNAVTFAASAVLMTRLRGHVAPARSEREDAAPLPANLVGVLKDPFVRSLVLTSGAVMLVAGATNVAELVLASDQLGGGRSGFALLVAAFGCGMLTGSLLAPRDHDALRRRYLLAIALLGAGLLATAIAPILPLAMLGFSVAGIGNGLFLVTVRVLMQKLIPEAAHGRAFGLLDAIDSWGFGAAIVAGGALAAERRRPRDLRARRPARPARLLHRLPDHVTRGGAPWVASGSQHSPAGLGGLKTSLGLRAPCSMVSRQDAAG